MCDPGFVVGIRPVDAQIPVDGGQGFTSPLHVVVVAVFLFGIAADDSVGHYGIATRCRKCEYQHRQYVNQGIKCFFMSVVCWLKVVEV